MSPRSEPLLWLQLLGLAAIPAELLAVVLILAGADPGPVRMARVSGCQWSAGPGAEDVDKCVSR